MTRNFGPPQEIIELGLFNVNVYDLAGPELATLVP